MTDEAKAALLEELKNDLDITWEDAATDRKLSRILDDGMAYLSGIAGRALDFSGAGDARALLFDYCRYTRSGAGDLFETNYQSQLIALQIMEAKYDGQSENNVS